MTYTDTDHTFVVCAYKESPFLEECLQSLLAQTVPSRILIATSTPNDLITELSRKYDLPVFVNTGVHGIGGDWNFALSQASTRFVTIAHQDDLYFPAYTETILARLSKAKEPLICFSRYAELRGSGKTFSTVTKNKLLRIKNLLLWPLSFFPRSRFVRRRVLSLGCPICCPAVTYDRETILAHPFETDLASNLDWQEWEKLSKLKGSFLYCKQVLMAHRIHTGSTTSAIIGENKRTNEDLVMFKKFWPAPIAKVIAKVYASGEKSNQV